MAVLFWGVSIACPRKIKERTVMSTSAIVQELNAEIERLTRARDVLTGSGHRGGRVVRRRRPMSPETKAKIGAAMAKRWAARRGKKK